MIFVSSSPPPTVEANNKRTEYLKKGLTSAVFQNQIAIGILTINLEGEQAAFKRWIDGKLGGPSSSYNSESYALSLSTRSQQLRHRENVGLYSVHIIEQSHLN